MDDPQGIGSQDMTRSLAPSPVSSVQPTSFDPYGKAIDRLTSLKLKKRISAAEFDLITSASSFHDVLHEVQSSKLKSEMERNAVDRFVSRVSSALLLRLDRFAMAMDLLAQSNSIATLLWGSMRFILVVGRDIFETFEMALNTLESIINSLPRFETYKATFDLDSVKILQEPLTNIYTDMLEFCLEAIGLHRRSRFKTILKSMWKSLKSDFSVLIVRMEANRNEVDKFALAQHMLESKAHYEETKELHLKTHELLSSNSALNRPGDQSYHIFEVPGLLSVYFTGRKRELQVIHSFFCSTGKDEAFPKRAVIHGMAGIGKTQVALKFANTYQSRYSTVLWTSAVNSIKMSQGYDRFAELLDLPEKSRTEQHVRINAVKRWLSKQAINSEGHSWLLILDNVDRGNIQEVFDFLPSSNESGGSILFTTRSHETAARLVGSAGLSIELSKMDDEEGVELLLSASEIEARDDETKMKASRIVASIGSLPLVLDQLAFIAREAQGDLDTCTKHVKENKSMMLRHKNFNPSYHESSVTATYEAAFRKMEEDEPDAAQLFSLLSFFDPEYVATDILTNNADQIDPGNPLLQVLKFSLNFERSVSQLRQFSVQRFTLHSDESRALWIHDLVQEMYRDRMSVSTQIECLELALTLLHSCFPEELLVMSDPATWKNYEKCLPHVVAGIKHAKTLDVHSVRFARLCRDAGWFLYHKGQYNRAIELTTMAIPLIEKHYGTEDDEWISAVNLLAAAHHTKGDYQMALERYKKVLKYRQKKYGRADTTVNTMHNIALCYHEAGEFDESQRRFEEIVSYWKTKYGPDHKDTLCSETSMARNMRYQGNFTRAEDLLQKCRKGLLKECGPQHIWSLLSLSELACAIWRRDQARYIEAEIMHREALAEKIRLLGEDHAHTWDSYADLGYMIWKCDRARKQEAEELMCKALKPYVETLTVDHSRTKGFYDYLVEFYRETGQAEKIESLAQKFGTPTIRPNPLIIEFSDEKDRQQKENKTKETAYQDLLDSQDSNPIQKQQQQVGIPNKNVLVPSSPEPNDDHDHSLLECSFPDVKSLPEPGISEPALTPQKIPS